MSRMARITSRPPISGIRRSTIATSARRVCSCAIASRPPEQARPRIRPAARTGRRRRECPARRRQRGARAMSRSYTLLGNRRELRTEWPAAEKAAPARRWPAPVRIARRGPRLPTSKRARAAGPGVRRRARQPGRSAAMTPRSTNAAWSGRRGRSRALPARSAAVTTSQPQPISAAET